MLCSKGNESEGQAIYHQAIELAEVFRQAETLPCPEAIHLTEKLFEDLDLTNQNLVYSIKWV